MKLRSLLILAVAVGLVGCDACDKKAPSSESALAAPTKPAAHTGPRAPTRVAAPALPPIPDKPLSKEDTAICLVESEPMQQVACLGTQAQRARDPRYCEVIASVSKKAGDKAPKLLKSGTAADACRRTIAYVRDDAQLCSSIHLASMAGSCLSYFAMKRNDSKVCELAKGEAASTCFLNEAARTRDATLCDKTGHFAEDCRKRLGPM